MVFVPNKKVHLPIDQYDGNLLIEINININLSLQLFNIEKQKLFQSCYKLFLSLPSICRLFSEITVHLLVVCVPYVAEKLRT